MKNKPSIRLKNKAEARFLLFESEDGCGIKISQGELNKILKQAVTDIKIVYVAACMS